MALDDWAITLIPVKKGDGLSVGEMEMRVLDPMHEGLQTFVAPEGRPTNVLWVDMDGLRLKFRPGCAMRPAVEYLYFWHRCALQRFEPDDGNIQPFWHGLSEELKDLKVMANWGLQWSLPPGFDDTVPEPAMPIAHQSTHDGD
jgi:hypothetical protein